MSAITSRDNPRVRRWQKLAGDARLLDEAKRQEEHAAGKDHRIKAGLGNEVVFA